MSEPNPNEVESLLQRALAPVDPPEGLADRVEARLQNLSALAAEELEGWELSSMRDPRNWVRPAVALAVGTAAGAGLVVLRVRHRHKRRKPANAAERTVQEVRRLLPRR